MPRRPGRLVSPRGGSGSAAGRVRLRGRQADGRTAATRIAEQPETIRKAGRQDGSHQDRGAAGSHQEGGFQAYNMKECGRQADGGRRTAYRRHIRFNIFVTLY